MGLAFLASPALLTGLTLLFAVYPAPLQALIEPFATLFDPADPEAHPTYLALWHGLTPVLGLSVLTWLLGLGLFMLRGPVSSFQARVPAVVDSERGYRTWVRAVDGFAVWLTARTQRGSLATTSSSSCGGHRRTAERGADDGSHHAGLGDPL